MSAPAVGLARRFDSEVLILAGASRQELVHAAERLGEFLAAHPSVELGALAYTLNCPLPSAGRRLTIVARTVEDLERKLNHALKRLSDPQCVKIQDRSGVFFFQEPLSEQGSLAFLFPGEGSQYPNMLSDLCLHLADLREAFDRADRVFVENQRAVLPSEILFPVSSTRAAEFEEPELWEMDCAVAALFAADQGLFELLRHLDIRPTAVVGHSSGEFAALLAAGALQIQDQDQLFKYSLDLNALALGDQVPDVALLAVGAVDPTVVPALLHASDANLYVTSDNSPHQIVLCADRAVIARTREFLQNQGAICSLLPFARPYHTPLFEPASQQLAEFYARLNFVPPHTTIYSCASARPYPVDPLEIRRLAVAQWAQPVRFRETIETMYADGIRIFVEVGPKANLTSFVEDVLRNRSHLAVPSNVPQHSGITQLNYLIGLLAAHGVAMQLDRLYAHRFPNRINLDETTNGAVSKSKGSAKALRLDLPRLELGPRISSPRETNLTTQQHAGAIPAENQTVFENDLLPPLRLGKAQTPSWALPDEQIARGPAEFSEPPVSGSERALIMEGYLQTMERFLGIQNEVMLSFMEGADPRATGLVAAPSAQLPSPNGSPPSNNGAEHTDSQDTDESRADEPFVLKVIPRSSDETMTATCELDVDQHLFLHHHTIGRQPSMLDESLTALPVVPLAMSLELMAAAAFQLVPNRRLIGFDQVRAHRWIMMDVPRRTLTLSAQRSRAENLDHVHVKIWQPPADSAPLSQGQLAVEGTLIFGDEYPPRPPTEPLPLQAERPYRFAPPDYYQKIMFHGRSFQSVTSIERCGDDGIAARVQLPKHAALFRSHDLSDLRTNPVLLDAAGQLTGFWAADRLDSRFVIFPIRVESLSLYAPLPRDHAEIKVQARLTRLEEERLESRIDFIDASGELFARITGWQDVRFDLPRPFVEFLLSPRDALPSRAWTAPPHPLAQEQSSAAQFRCARLEVLPDSLLKQDGAVWLRAIAFALLSRRERESWSQRDATKKRSNEWLMGRLAAKAAVRALIKDRWGLTCSPADIEIVPDEYGCPKIVCEAISNLKCHLSVSIAHADGHVVALAGDSPSNQGVGIDIERVRPEHGALEKGALAEREQLLLWTIPVADRDEWLLRLWCAKEAVAKALGRGMAGSPLFLQVQDVEPETGKVIIQLAGELLQQLPSHQNKLFTAWSGREDEMVFASALA